MTTTNYIAISYYGGQRPQIATIADAYKIYTDLGGMLSQRKFAEKAKEYDGVSLGYENGEVRVTFTADILTKIVDLEFKNITTFVDIDTDKNDYGSDIHLQHRILNSNENETD